MADATIPEEVKEATKLTQREYGIKIKIFEIVK